MVPTRMLNVLLLLLTTVFASNSPLLDKEIQNDGIVYADTDLMEVIFSNPRNYTISVLLTAITDRVPCEFCKVLRPGFTSMASSYNAKTKPEDRELYFILADVDRNMAVFKTLGLTHVPNLAFYKPTTNKADIKKGLLAEHVFTSFTSNTDQLDYLVKVYKDYGFDIHVVKPFDWTKFGKFISTVLAVGISGFVFRKKVIQVWQSKQIWLALSLMCVVMFISGHMFNVIRGTPFVGGNGELIEGSYGNQYAVETQIVATLYGLLAFTVIGLVKFVSKLENVQAQSLFSIIGAVLVLFLYSVLIETYKVKTGGYAFGLLPIKIF